mmetsp:Transcript_39656/g.71362  ORF Transcript_39656/g.71362 Transcript_39656/m.71362 type:complete len:109 (+) Transcript_39656:603-929(+)
MFAPTFGKLADRHGSDFLPSMILDAFAERACHPSLKQSAASSAPAGAAELAGPGGGERRTGSAKDSATAPLSFVELSVPVVAAARLVLSLVAAVGSADAVVVAADAPA